MALYDENDPDVVAYRNMLQQRAQPQQGVLNQIDPTWLALAQGFLSPTKTGSFGESLGNAATQLQGPLSKMKDQQMTALEKIAQLKEAQARLQLQRDKQAQDTGDNDYVTQELKRAQALNYYNNIDANIRKQYQDQFGNWTGDDAEKKYNQESSGIKARIQALQGQNRPGGPTAIGAATGNDTNAPITIPNEQLKINPTPNQSAEPKPISRDEVLSKYPNAFQRGNDWIVVQDGKEYKVQR